MAIVHAIGMPENNSERKAIAYFRENLPGDDYVLFHNLELPTRSGLPYEYDAIVVGEHAVYCLEVKGYRGAIKGNAHEWELESGAIRTSPIPLANKKAKVVADRLRRHSPLLGRVWVEPIIVLTDDRVRCHLNDDQAHRVLRLDEAASYILDPLRLPIRPAPIGHLTDRICEAIFGQFRPLRRQQEIGEYRVLETTGRNRLFTSLLAEHKLVRTEQRFSLKVYNLDVYAGAEARRKTEEWILRDANALHRLGSHPNIVRAYLPFPWQDHQYVLPLEWVDGYSLRGLIDSGGEIDLARKYDIVRQTCKGLSFAHSRGVIHRDLNPDNVLVPSKSPVKIVNFDCSRVEGDNLQTIATRVGRELDERYVAPEVWENAADASVSSDIYSLGTVIFEVLTGRPPYDRIREVFDSGGLPSSPTDFDPTLSSDWDEIVGRMCAFDAQQRYQNLQEAMEDLDIVT